MSGPKFLEKLAVLYGASTAAYRPMAEMLLCVCDTTTQPLKSKDDGRGGGPKHNLGKIILKKSRPRNS